MDSRTNEKRRNNVIIHDLKVKKKDQDELRSSIETHIGNNIEGDGRNYEHNKIRWKNLFTTIEKPARKVFIREGPSQKKIQKYILVRGNE